MPCISISRIFLPSPHQIEGNKTEYEISSLSYLRCLRARGVS
jgi:hypothetical protein